MALRKTAISSMLCAASLAKAGLSRPDQGSVECQQRRCEKRAGVP
jgi:hypothetical protein